MKRFLPLLLVILLTSCFETAERNCLDFKTGTFEFEYSIDGVEKTGRFVRTENLNIDYYEGKADSSSIRWINDCEFILKKINPTRISEKDPIHMKILSTTEDSYTFEYKLAIKKLNREVLVKTGIAKKVK
jgi:hypothetical protein